MRNFWPHPVRGDDIHPRNLFQVKLAGFPTFGIATIGMPVKIADIVQRDLILYLFIMQHTGYFRVPVTVLLGIHPKIPKQPQGKTQKINQNILIATEQMLSDINAQNAEGEG